MDPKFASLMRGNIQTDLRKWLKLNCKEAERTLQKLAQKHGCLLNCSALGRLLGVSYHTVQNRLAELEKAGVVRLLYPLSFHTEKRLLKTPKVYLRDIGLLNQLLGIQNPAKLEGLPRGMRVFAGFMIEQIFIREQAKGGVCSFHYYGGFDGAHIDLILDQPGLRIGILFRFTDRIGPRNWTRLKSILRRKIIKRGFVVYTGRRGFFASRDILALPALCFLNYYDIWFKEGSPKECFRETLSRYNMCITTNRFSSKSCSCY